MDHVLEHGLASLAERWTLESPGEEPEIVCIQEANEYGVTVALGYYSMPGVPTLRISRAAELDRAQGTLTRSRTRRRGRPDTLRRRDRGCR